MADSTTTENTPDGQQSLRVDPGPQRERAVDNDVLIAEYQAAQDCYLHYDNFPWQVGTLLVAGVFVFWGLLLSQTENADLLLVGLASFLVSILMSLWLLYVAHARQIYLAKLDRIQEIERILGMEQHRRFVKGESAQKHYRIFGVMGHRLNVGIYFIACLGGPLLGCVQSGYSPWLIPAALLPFAISAWRVVNDHRFSKTMAD